MKKAIACVYPALRGTLTMLLAILLLSALVQTGLFYGALRRAEALCPSPPPNILSQYGSGYFATPLSFADVVRQARLPLVFSLTLLAVMALFCLFGCHFGSRSGYTLARLSLPPLWVRLLWGWYYALCFALLLCGEALLCRAFGALYMRGPCGAQAGSQALALAFYTNDFLHSLAPLAEHTRLMRNAVICLRLGVCASAFSAKQRRSGRISYAAIAAGLFAARFFAAPLGAFASGLFVVGVLTLLTGVCLFDGGEEA